MRQKLNVVFVGIVLGALFFGGSAAAASRANDYIVVLEPSADLNAALKQAERLPGTKILDVYSHAVNGYAARLTPPGLRAVRSNPSVLFVSADRPVKGFGQQVPTGVSRIGAAPLAAAQASLPVVGAPLPVALPSVEPGTGVGVAVIDTGIDLTHPDLSPVVPGPNCLNKYKTPNDDNGHGSHVSGIIAARDNGIGVVGVAPGATLYAVKALDANAFGYWSSIICGVDWVTARSAVIKVANMSLGGSGTATPSNPDCTNSNNDALHYAICRSVKAGVTYVVAAGNSATDASTVVPAAYDEVITVSALSDSDGKPGGLGGAPGCDPSQSDDTFASFSDYGAPVDIAAPGVCIFSTYMNGGYATMSGTSMATPHVVGAAARYLQQHPLAGPAEVKAALLAGAEPGPITGDPDPYKEGVVHVAALAGSSGVLGLPLPPVPVTPPSAPPAPPAPPIPPLPPLP